jgi:integrase
VRAEGRDPIEERRAQRDAAKLEAAKAMTFRDCAERYIAAHEPGWRNARHRQQWPATLGAYAYPVFGDLPVTAVDTALVMQAIEPIWNEKPETASRVRGRIESVVDWARARGYRQGENPARWRGHLENLLPARRRLAAVAHHAALPYPETAMFMADLRGEEGIAARALEFLVLTAARTGEVLGARWSEIDLAAKIWTIPAERMKTGREHRVPLSGAALAIVEVMAAIRSGEYVFPGAKAGRPLSQMALLVLLRRRGRSNVTVHGFRSTFATWCKDVGVAAELREMALAHAEGDKVAAAYTSGAEVLDRRRDLAERWAQFCDGSDRGHVVPLRAARG